MNPPNSRRNRPGKAKSIPNEYLILKTYCPYYETYSGSCTNKQNGYKPTRQKGKVCDAELCPFKSDKYQIKNNYIQPKGI